MKTYLKTALVAASLAISVNANAGFMGNTIEATALFPDLAGSGVTGGPVTEVVGAGVEFTDGEFGAFFGPTFDFDDMTITITHAQTGHQSGSFNGYQFFDSLGAIDSFVGLTVLSDNTGFFSGDPSRVFFDSENIYVNFESLFFSNTTDPTIVLGVDFASVPEPATLALMGLGLAGIGFSRRRVRNV